MNKHRVLAIAAAAVLVGTTLLMPSGKAEAAVKSKQSVSVTRSSPGKIDVSRLSAGAKAWFAPPTAQANVQRKTLAPAISFGTNVDANDPSKDLVAGQSETAIAASGSNVVTAWNDSTGFVIPNSTDRRASVTGVGYSTDGGRHFKDLIGLRNNNANQQWFGDPTVAAIDANHFAIGSLYLPSLEPDCSEGPARFALAVEILTIKADGTASLGLPVRAANGGDYCKLLDDNEDNDPADIAFLDKEWISYDKATRTLGMSFTRFFFGLGDQAGTGKIDYVRAHVPANPAALSTSAWSRPITVWPEEPDTVNEGAYVAMAAGGDAYIAWERNVDSNTENGDPYVYIHAARVRLSDTSPVVGGRGMPRVVTLGQRNSNGYGGVKSLDTTFIAGFNRGTGQDFPRLAINPKFNKVILVWNDASLHPLGDIWMRALPMDLRITGPIQKVNDDNSWALHFLPAVSVRADGSTVTSWYDRRLNGADSTRTDYFGEIRETPTTGDSDFRITTGSTDWAGTSSTITPNFGDYTDNVSTGNRTYFTWSDGRIGVPQPFVDRR